MKPIEFEGMNVTFAKDQEPYLPLPGHRNTEGEVTTCWKFSFFERCAMVLKGKLYLRVLTFNKPIQPMKICFHKPELTL